MRILDPFRLEPFAHDEVSSAQVLTLAKIRRCYGLPPLKLVNGPSPLPDSWKPDARLMEALGHLPSGDIGPMVLDLNSSPAADGDCLAVVLASELAAGSTVLTELHLRACGIGPLGIRALTRALNGSTHLRLLE